MHTKLTREFRSDTRLRIGGNVQTIYVRYECRPMICRATWLCTYFKVFTDYLLGFTNKPHPYRHPFQVAINVNQSMSIAGLPHDNAVIENIYGWFKNFYGMVFWSIIKSLCQNFCMMLFILPQYFQPYFFPIFQKCFFDRMFYTRLIPFVHKTDN